MRNEINRGNRIIRSYRKGVEDRRILSWYKTILYFILDARKQGLNKGKFQTTLRLLRSRSASHSKRKALVIKCEKESKREGKQKKSP